MDTAPQPACASSPADQRDVLALEQCWIAGSREMAEAAEALSIASSRASVAMGARVEGIDLARDSGADVVAELRELLLEHHLLVLPGQELSALELEAFGRRWGDLLTHPATKHRDSDYVQFIGSRGAGKYQFFPDSIPFARSVWAKTVIAGPALPGQFPGVATMGGSMRNRRQFVKPELRLSGPSRLCYVAATRAVQHRRGANRHPRSVRCVARGRRSTNERSSHLRRRH